MVADLPAPGTVSDTSTAALALSVVAPARDEVENVATLIEEVEHALAGFRGAFELIVVDDGSGDGTGEAVRACMQGRSWLRLLTLRDTTPGRGHGQAAAFHAGFRAARGRFIASLDADLQNDPADLPRLVGRLEKGDVDLVQGDRSGARQDSALRRLGSRVGRAYRRLVLGDRIRDTGCSLRVMRREVALALPLELTGMHRFIPVVARQLGYRVEELPVAHRPRMAGRTKYGLGLGRAVPGLIDGLAVRWMRSRRRPVDADETPQHPEPGP